MDRILQDVRYGLRMLRKQPGFTAVAVLALALGIGANTAIFSVVNGVLLRPLPYTDPDSLVMVWERNIPRNRATNVVSPANYLDWAKQTQTLDPMAALVTNQRNLTSQGEPQVLEAQFVTVSFFNVLGVQAARGRTFTEEEGRAGNDQVVILSDRLWQRLFGSSDEILGQPITLHGRSFTVVGVMPADFYFMNRDTDIWLPMALDSGQDYRATSGRYLMSVARLKPGVTCDQAQAEMEGIAAQLEQTYQKFNAGWSVNLVPLHEQIVGDIRPIILVLLGAVGFVLLIACANVANLLLARAATRQKELALRTALGAARSRIISQLMIESVLLATFGGALGLLLAYWGLKLLVAASPDNIPRLNEIAIDWSVLVFTIIMSFLTGIIFGLVPALQSSKPDLNATLKEGGRGSKVGGSSRIIRNLFVIAEVALSLVLLIGAGLMIKSFLRLQNVKPGFRTENILTLRLQLPGSKYRDDTQRIAFFKQLEERLRALPGVADVGAINFLQLAGQRSATSFTIADRPEPPPGEQPVTDVRVVTPSYFDAMAIPLIKGRMLDERDTAKSQRVLLINETMARLYWPDEEPLGKRVKINWDSDEPDEIVGVVGDIRDMGLNLEVKPTIYWPHSREPYAFMNFVLYTRTDPRGLASAAQAEVKALDPEQPVAEIRTMEDVLSESISRQRFNMLLLVIFASVALVLAVVGIYGVIAYSVTQRTHEIGIRMALGAQSLDILKMVIGQSLLLTGIGLIIGVAGAMGLSLLLSNIMSGLLFDVGMTDLTTFLMVSLVLATAAMVATVFPARRATKVDPMVALRYE
jgi:putative ABC transport system permease protein